MNRKVAIYCTKFAKKPVFSYIREEDITTIESLKEAVAKVDKYNGYFTQKGIDLLEEKFGVLQVLDIFHNTYEHQKNGYFTIDTDFYHVHVFDEKSYIAALGGTNNTKFEYDFKMIGIGVPFHITAPQIMNFIKKLASRKGTFNDYYYSKILNFIPCYTTFDWKKDVLSYNANYLLYKLIDYGGSYVSKARSMVDEDFDNVIYNEGKPIEKQRIPEDTLEYLLNFYETMKMDNPTEEEKHNYIFILNKLCAFENENGLKAKAKAYYEGNAYLNKDYYQAEATILKLLDIGFDAEYATLLGNIYFNGDVNNHVPQYDKAFKYYSLGALGRNPESIFKLGDMYYSGLGVTKNVTLALDTYTNLFDDGLIKFKENHDATYFPDILYRMGSRWKISEDQPLSILISVLCLLEGLKCCEFLEKPNVELEKQLKESCINFYKQYEGRVNDSNLVHLMTHNFSSSCMVVASGSSIVFTNFPGQVIIPCVKEKTCLYSKSLTLDFPENTTFKRKTIYNYDSIEIDYHTNTYSIVCEGKIQLQFSGNFKVRMADKEKLFLDLNADEYVYTVAQCTFDEHHGNIYHYIVDNEEEALESNLYKKWIVIESDHHVYPVKFIHIRRDNFPVPQYRMKHIRIDNNEKE